MDLRSKTEEKSMTAMEAHPNPQSPVALLERGVQQGRGQFGASKIYDCYFVNRSLRTLSQEKIQCADDGAAMSAAAELLRSHTCSGIEVWHRGRCVGQLLREVMAHGSPNLVLGRRLPG